MKYRWVCHLCKEANTASSAICEKCGFPALASGRDIDCATGNASPTDGERDKAAVRLPLCKKIAVGIAFGGLIVGAFLAKFAYPPWLNIAGLLLIGLGSFVIWSLGFFGRDKSG